MSKRLREELERFFLNTTFFSHKDARSLGWKGPKCAEQKVEAAIK